MIFIFFFVCELVGIILCQCMTRDTDNSFLELWSHCINLNAFGYAIGASKPCPLHQNWIFYRLFYLCALPLKFWQCDTHCQYDTFIHVIYVIYMIVQPVCSVTSLSALSYSLSTEYSSLLSGLGFQCIRGWCNGLFTLRFGLNRGCLYFISNARMVESNSNCDTREVEWNCFTVEDSIFTLFIYKQQFFKSKCILINDSETDTCSNQSFLAA